MADEAASTPPAEPYLEIRGRLEFKASQSASPQLLSRLRVSQSGDQKPQLVFLDTENRTPGNLPSAKSRRSDEGHTGQPPPITLTGDGWEFTGGSQIRFCDRGDVLKYDVPVRSVNVRAGKTGGTGVVELFANLPPVGTPESAVVISTTIPRSLKDKEEFGKCCMQLAVDSLCDNFKWCDQQFRAVLGSIGVVTDPKKTIGSNVRVSLAPRAIRWRFAQQKSNAPFSVPVAIIHEVFATSSRLRRLGTGGPADTLGIALAPNDGPVVDTQAGRFWVIATAIWPENDKDEEFGDPEVSVEVAWDAPTQQLTLSTPPRLPSSPSLENLLRAADAQAAASRHALEHVVGRQPESFLPQIEKLEWRDARPAVILYKQHCRMSVNRAIEIPVRDPGTRAVVSIESPLSTSSSSRQLPVATLSLPGIGFSGSGRHLEVKLDHDPTCLEAVSDTGDVVASFRLCPTPDLPPTGQNRTTWSARLGALALDGFPGGGLATDPENGNSMSRLVITRSSDVRGPSPSSVFPVGVEWHLRLALDRVTPEGVDRPWGDREARRLPLVVPQWREQAGSEPARPFVLVVTESAAPGNDRWLRAELLDNAEDSGGENEASTMLSFEPWSVLRFTRRRLARLGDAENATVALFDSDDRTWRFKQAIPEYAFQFPVQGIGESADKPGILEIHDLDRYSEHLPNMLSAVRRDGQSIDVLRPVPLSSDRNAPTDPIERRFVLETRFSPSLDLWVKPNDLDRNYILPEWQAHEIFRRRNDFGLGVALRAMRGEFLYGLSVGVDATREPGPAGMARVAEIEALAGKLPPLLLRPSPSRLQAPLLARWRRLRRALVRRSERIEVWTPAYDQIRPFVYARFEKGATFALRSTALHRHPLNEPKPGDEEPAIRLEPHGLPGGALWPLESSSVLDALVRHPESSGGTIERIAIAPGGGDADQSARFLGDQVTIASQTRAGFLQRQRIEILGRIGVFWHRAKHVIIYERTVNPSEQFAPLADSAGWHATRSRRAIVRKVSEYIEILQPTRAYPDSGAGTDAACGFLDSVRFNTRIIHVDGTWKTEIAPGNNQPAGYKIPLWKPGAAAQRPNVYPLPSVSVVTLGEGKEERPLVPRQIANPENLFFYTQLAGPTDSVSLSPSDPDSWDPVFGIDYGNLVDPAELERLVAPGGDAYGGTDSTNRFGTNRKPSTPVILPGHQRFTWRLLPDGKRTALNAGFGDKPVYGDLDSITFSRGMAEPLKDELRTVASASPDQLEQLVQRIKRQPTDALGSFLTTNKDTLSAVASACATLYANPLSCDRLKNTLPDALKKKKRLLQTTFHDWARQAEKWTDEEIKEAIASATALKAKISQLLDVRSVVGELLGEAETGVSDIRNDIATLRIAVRDHFVAIRATVQRSVGRVAALLETAERDLASAGAMSKRLLTESCTHLTGEITLLQQQIAAEKDEVLQRFSAETTSLAAQLIADLAQQLDGFVTNTTESLNIVVDKLTTASDSHPTFDEHRKALLPLSEIERKVFDSEHELLRLLDVPSHTLAELLGTADNTLGLLLQQSRKAIDDHVTNTALLGFLDELSGDAREQVDKVRARVVAEFRSRATDIDRWVNETVDGVRSADAVTTTIDEACAKAAAWFGPIGALGEKVKEAAGAVASAIEGSDPRAVVQSVEALASAAGKSPAIADAYTSRVSEALADLGPGVPKPGKVLALVSAATQAPEIGQMQANIDRMRCSYKQGQIATSKAMASFSKLGNALKALGIELPFNGLGDQLQLDDSAFADFQKSFDLQRLLPDFGGIKLDKLLEGVKLPETPAEFREAVKLRHDFDKVHFRAWAQIDVNMPIKDRKKLFGIGPMAMYFRDSLLTGSVRAEASKDTDDISTTGSGLIETNIDVDVNGELIVSLERVRIEYSQQKKLHVDFDPKRIRLHSAMQFVQDTFGDILGDQIGGLTIVKERGLPVGLEHQFKLPVMSLMAGTSGISNIQMSNGFRLLAYPDFVISNRFCLSKPELPFLFTFFILGGTGYVIVDARYRPLDQALTVEVEAAIGGAAALGIATGAISGQVFITLSVALTYRKTFVDGQGTGAGLSVAAVLVVAGNVNIAGVVDVYIGVVLRMTYREGGAIDGVGTVTVEVKISVFFTFKFRSEMTLKMRGGRAETTKKIETSGKPGPAVEKLRNQVADYRQKADQLQNARV